MFNDNAVGIEAVKPYDGMYVISESSLRDFQAGHLSLGDLFSRRFRIPTVFLNLDSPVQACEVGPPNYNKR